VACTYRIVACNPPRTGVYGPQRGLEMKLTPICGRLTLVGLLSTLAACGDGGGGGSSASDAGTIAYVETFCREVAGAATMRQELRIYHGGETVTAMSVGPLGPFTSYGVCGRMARERAGVRPMAGAFQRLGVIPGGSGVVFEVTDEYSNVGRDLLPVSQRGMYYVRANGRGLRRLGPVSRVPSAVFIPPDYTWQTGQFNFDPSGRRFTYPDLGPDDAGAEAPQVFVQRIATGERRQLTRLPRVAESGGPPDIIAPRFLDARTILFKRFASLPDRIHTLTLDTEALQLSDVRTVALPGGRLIPIFQIVGEWWEPTSVTLPGEAVNSRPPFTSIVEVFVTDGANVLQLTDFGRVDTSAEFFSPRDQRVYFTASADPLGGNPSHDCQIFSIDPLTREMRQVTFFHEDGDHVAACFGGRQPNGCTHIFPPGAPSVQEPVTGTIYLASQCDPLGLNPNGRNLFAIQPDGTGLRQLTSARGFSQGADRTVDADMIESHWTYAPPR